MDQATWNQFVLAHGPRSGRFLQSWEWGEFQKSFGEHVRRETFLDEGKVVGIAQWLDRKLPLSGSYAFCPKGPIGAWQPRRTSHLFLRVEPSDSDLPTYARKSIDLDPAHTLITNLSSTEDDLMATMHHKTRYNIRLAQKKGVNITLTGGNVTSIWELFEQTSSRGQFRLHRREYYEKMLESLSDGACRAFLATASHEGTLLAANVMIDFGDTRTYLHGASSNEHRNLMGPYLLHWELMRDAKAQGLRFYDWWGVAPQDADENHPWGGISRFKRGFGGEEATVPGTYDVILKPWRYRLYQSARRLRRFL